MSTSYFGFSVSNTNGSAKQRSCVRVYDKNNTKIAEQFINCQNPVGYLRSRTRSKHLDQLRAQCITGGMTNDEFNQIFWCGEYQNNNQ